MDVSGPEQPRVVDDERKIQAGAARRPARGYYQVNRRSIAVGETFETVKPRGGQASQCRTRTGPRDRDAQPLDISEWSRMGHNDPVGRLLPATAVKLPAHGGPGKKWQQGGNLDHLLVLGNDIGELVHVRNDHAKTLGASRPSSRSVDNAPPIHNPHPLTLRTRSKAGSAGECQRFWSSWQPKPLTLGGRAERGGGRGSGRRG